MNGTQAEILSTIRAGYPDTNNDLARAYTYTKRGKQEVFPYQAAVLYALAKQYNREEAQILEIGTYYGLTAAVIAEAAPKANIITLNPLEWEVQDARYALHRYENVSVICRHSWDYLEMLAPEWMLDMVFIDGDHKRVRLDLPWWNRVKEGGLILFHDYTPLGNPRHCPPVYEVVNEFAGYLGREMDVAVIDTDNVGMAGFYKKPDDPAWRNDNAK
jgi:predicted O-methyltransferase YrrM